MTITLEMELDEIETSQTKQYINNDIVEMLDVSTMNYKNIELRIGGDITYKAAHN